MPGDRSCRLESAIVRKVGRGTLLEDIDTSQVPASDFDVRLVGPRPAMVIATDAADEFLERFNRGEDCFVLTKKQVLALGAATGQAGMTEKLLLSCIRIRLEFTAQLIQQWSKHWKKHRGEPSRQYMFITILTDSGNTLARRPFIDLEALRRRIDKLLRPLGLDAVFMTEVQLLTNFPRFGYGATHQWHGHCIATINDSAFDVEAIKALLCQSGRLSNVFGAPTVRITSIETLAHLMRCCAYMSKLPAVGKRIVPDPKIPGAWTFDKVFVRKDEAFRLVEGLSQIEIGQVVHSIGNGKHILRPAMKALRQWHKLKYAKARHKLTADDDIADIWGAIRGSRVNDVNEPYRIGSRSEWPPSYDWEELARDALAAMNAARDAKRRLK